MGIVALVTIFVALYLILLIPSVQNSIKSTAEKELAKVLDTKVEINRLSIAPFNQVVLYDVEVPDKYGETLMKVEKIGAGLSLYNLLIKGRLVFTYAELVGVYGNIYKQTPESQTNIQFLIDVLSPKDKNKPPTKFDLAIYNIVLRKSCVTYNVLSESESKDKFDVNHIKIKDLRADIALPRLKNDDFKVKIKRLSFIEQSGFSLKNLTVNTIINNKCISVSDFRVELPETYIATEDFSVSFNSLKTLGSEFGNLKLDICTRDSYISLKDFSAIIPSLTKITEPIKINMHVTGSVKDLNVSTLNLRTKNEKNLVSINGTIKNVNKKDSLILELPKLYVKADANEVGDILSHFVKLTNQAKNIICNAGNVVIDGALKGSLKKSLFKGKIQTLQGALLLDGDFEKRGDSGLGFKGVANTNNFKLGTLLGKNELLGETSFNIEVDGVKTGRIIEAKLKGSVDYLDFKGYRYNDIVANFEVNPTEFNGSLAIDDENMSVSLDGLAKLQGVNSKIDMNINVEKCNLANVNLYSKYPMHNLSFNLNANTEGDQIENLNGRISIENLRFVDNENNGIELDSIQLIADNTITPYHIQLASDVVNGKLEGYYNFESIVPCFKRIIGKCYPALLGENITNAINDKNINNFDYSFKIENNDKVNNLLSFFKSPVKILYPITIKGYVDEGENLFGLDVDAPYLAQNKKLIEESHVKIDVDSISGKLGLNVHTIMPTKKGKMSLDLQGQGYKNRFDTDLSWNVDRKEDFHGNVNMSIALGRVNETNSVMATIKVNPTTMVFNDTAWYVRESKIGFYNNVLRVDDFRVTCDKQFVAINGKTSTKEDDILSVELNDINLDYIFETLQINNVTFGGVASGKINASELLTKSPKLETDRFFVDDMSYNETLLGDADIRSFWDNDNKFVAIQALITHPNECNSVVDGEIYPMNDSMRFDFKTEKIKVGFMKPFMSAFTSDLDGYASGNATLYGKFSTLNMYGDIFVEDLKVKLDYTNVYYWATDSVKIVPGLITFNDVQLKDRYGKTAKLSGYVSHQDFHNAVFKFDVTDAKELLCYDIPEKRVDNWYGTIFGSGSAFVNGEPGLVDIDVHMATAANSKFYFELSDALEATDYDFITFTDKRREELEAEIIANKSIHEQIISNFEQKVKQEESKSRMIINIDADINNLGQLILVMDPVGGDKIKANGSGTLIMKYDSSEDLFMQGKYTLDKGTYNFTLQDIIVKDFVINSGSSIAFEGNPYDAKIDIAAVYPLNANLLDLDESFAADKEFNRTNVPVHALLNVSGSIAQPNISFDLEFPTLTSDAYRKVKSIVSTDDMMNRQIIYLLALNRFYTPEYMGGTNRNNELASVASSTLSSQLSSMLGQISDKWSISPNFRSDKGDFSDVEVNLALSSQLLNNRLLINGNFGYRDKMISTNNSNFIGDFDIEYLLNKAGNIRLKAYNHFNDQNFYVKNALTTQGVGFVFKYDFDKLFDFSKKKTDYIEKIDSIESKQPKDSSMINFK